MACSKHPNYKGYRKSKRDCPECLEVWRKVQKELWDKGQKYQSITTPGFKCSIEHLFAEISCVMLFGKLPPFFWRKGQSILDVQEQYKKAFFYVKSIKKYDKILSGIEIVMNAIYIRPFKQRVTAILQKSTTTQHTTENIPIDNIEFVDGKSKQNTQKAMHDLFTKGEINEKES